MARRLTSLGVPLLVTGIALALVVTFWSQQLALRDPSHASGWTLLGLTLLLFAFGVRKKLPHPPLLGARFWLQLHLGVGVLALVVFVLHLNGWPDGRLEWLLLSLFALTALSGLLGWLASRAIPPLLTAHGEDVIYESIPLRAREIRERAQALVVGAAGMSSRSILGRIYRRELAGFFALPKPWWRQLGARRRARRIRHELRQSRRYLSADERRAADELELLVDQRAMLDDHQAWQGVLKAWLFVHIPLGGSLLIVVGLHVLVVHAFSGAAP